MHIGWELRSSLVGDTILGVQSEPACILFEMLLGQIWSTMVRDRYVFVREGLFVGCSFAPLEGLFTRWTSWLVCILIVAIE